MTPFRLPTHIHFGSKSFESLTSLVRSYSPKHVLLVSDHGLTETPWPAKAQNLLESLNVRFTFFDQVEKNPRSTTIESLAQSCRRDGVDLVIGLGGGSVLDAAKAVAMMVSNPGSCADFVGKNRFSNPPVPFLAIPTTCGTGSEVTWVSVITVEADRTKISVKGDGMFPDHAIVDPDTLETLPKGLIASTGVDALTHALEAYTGSARNGISDALAEKAIVLLHHFLLRAKQDPNGDEEARSEVMRASTLAGMAFGNADVAAVHCLSETIGGRYDAPHGLVNAMLLGPVLSSHRPHVDGSLAKLEGLLTGSQEGSDEAKAADAYLSRLETLVADLEIPRFESLQISLSDYEAIAKGAVQNGSNGSNPRPMGEKDYLEILQSA